MIKHIQIICQLFPTNILSVFYYFVGLALKELNKPLVWKRFAGNFSWLQGTIFPDL